MALSHAQRAYWMARLSFDALDASRDRLLEPIDLGHRPWLSAQEQQELAWLNQAQSEVYPLVLAAEAPLVCWARSYLAQHPEELARDSENAMLLADPIPLGQWERVVSLAAHIGMRKERRLM